MQALLAVMERVSSGIAISLPNLMVILATELHSFLVTHQPNLIGYERPILDSLRSFFSRYIFPLVSSWLGNFCSVFTQELHSPLVIEKNAFSPISDEDLNKIRNLIKKSYSVNPEIFCTEICVNLDKFNCVHPFPIKMFVPLWWLQVRSSLQDSLLRYIEESTYVDMHHRPSSGVFNFTSTSIPSSLNDLLLKGIKFVPHSPSVPSSAHLSSQFADEIKAQAGWYRRRVEKNLDNIPECDLPSTLHYLSKNSVYPHRIFYNVLMKKSIDSINSFKVSPLSSPDCLKLPDCDPPSDCSWNIADKSFGIILLPSSYILQQEEKKMTDLGGTKLDIAQCEIIDDVFKQIYSFKHSVSGEASRFLEKFKLPPKSKCYLPFLKLQGKIYKLSQQDIMCKNLSPLKFRPIIDSKMFPTQPLSSALRMLLVDLNSAITSKFPFLNISPTSGWEFSTSLQSLDSFPVSGFSIMYVCDLSDAYTNCNLDDLIKAVHTLTVAVGPTFPQWKTELIFSLANLVLSNSYVEAANSCWKCGTSLPMGSKCSGDALETICLAGEMTYLSSHINIPPTTYFDIPFFYRRFRDDIFSIHCSTSSKIILDNLHAFSNIFHPRIPLQFKFTILTSSYLDCTFFKNLTNNSYSTLPRFNLSTPISIPHHSSASPQEFIYNGVFCNLLRARRICNEDSLFLVYKSIIRDELRQCGYPEDYIHSIFHKSQQCLQDNFCPDYYTRIVPRGTKLHPPGINYSTQNVHKLVRSCVYMSLVACGKSDKISVPAIKAPKRLKNIIFSRKKHLNAMSLSNLPPN